MEYKYNLLKKKIDRRSFIILLLKLTFLLFLLIKDFFLQFINRKKYKTLSENNRIKFSFVPSLRGEIFDSLERVLALNSDNFNLAVRHNNLSTLLHEVTSLKDILCWNKKNCEKIVLQIKATPKYSVQIIKHNISWEVVSFLEENKEIFTNFFVDIENSRIYPYGKATSHVVGYLRKGFNNSYNQNMDNTNTGQAGLEKYYHQKLKGVDGYQKIEKDALGKANKVIQTSHTIKGQNIFTNLDAELQKDFLDMIPNMTGSIIVSDCNNGNIISMLSFPVFEPQNMINPSQKDWSEIHEDMNYPLINRAVQSMYPPGSVFKIVTALAALEYGIDIKHKFECTGAVWINKTRFGCANKNGHGFIDMSDALKYSCNCYMYNLVKIIGHKKILETAKELGLGSRTLIDLPEEKEGFLPSSEWKYRKFKQSWLLGDSFNLSIGQGFTLVTPIQLSVLISAIANGGFINKPNIVSRISCSQKINVSSYNLELIRIALNRAINEKGGTGYYRGRFNLTGITMSGKTGTAQVLKKKSEDDNLDHVQSDNRRRNHSIFVGYTPSINPKFSIVLYCSNMGSGSRFATPLAKNIFIRLLQKYSTVL